MEEKTIVKKEKAKKKIEFFSGTGRRKSAIARVWIFPEKGEFTINDKNPKDYFPLAKDTLEWVRAFHAVGISHPQAKYSGGIKVNGGGKASQVQAVKLGIARALLVIDETFKPILRSNGLLTRDSREKERRKPFFKKARKKPQYSKR